MNNYSYKKLEFTAQPRSKKRRNAAGGSSSFVGGVPGSGSGGGTGTGVPGSGSGGLSSVDVQQGEGVLVEKSVSSTRAAFKISHAVTGNGESTDNDETYIVRNIIVDKFGHIKNIEVAKQTDAFDERYLRKDQPDETTFNITFKAGATFGDFVEGFLGSGGRIDENGNCWFGGMHLREFLEVPELRFNRIDVVSGELWNSIAFGLIESVDAVNQIVTLKLEDGELSGLHINDYCRGIYHNLTGNESTQGVDQNNFDKLVGFSTSYFTPVQILDNARFKYALQPGTTQHPTKAMKFAVYGNATDTGRQASAYSTRNYVRYLRDVDTWDIKPQHITLQMGDLSNLIIDGESLAPGSIYLNNVYFGGNILQTGGLADSLKGEDAYTVGLSNYAHAYNTAAGNVPSDISFTAFASKGDAVLTYSTTVGSGKFTLSIVSAVGCTVLLSTTEPKITFNTFVGDKTGTVTLRINCEGFVSFTQVFIATKVQNGSPGIPGTPGASGSDGNIERSIYRRSNTQPETPAGANPSGWSFDPPAGTIDLYMSKATFTAAGVLVSSWSYPIKITGDKGNDGSNGNPGPSTTFRSTYSSSTVYNGTEYLVDVVKYGNYYYRALPTAGTFSGIIPTNTNYWTRLNSFENIATGLLIAEQANIAGWIYRTNYVSSQSGSVILDGNADSGPRIAVGATYANRANAPFRVYENGSFYASSAEIAGTSKIGGFQLSNGWLTCTADTDGYIMMRGNSKDTEVSFGQDLIPSISGGTFTCTARITNNNVAATGSYSETIGLQVRAQGSSSVYGTALIADGGVRMKGRVGFARQINYITGSNSLANSSYNMINNLLLYQNNFVYAGSTSFYIYLPSDTSIASAFSTISTGVGVVDNAFIHLRFLMPSYVSTSMDLISVIPIKDKNGNDVREITYPNNPYSLRLQKGNYIELTYYNRAYYITNKNY